MYKFYNPNPMCKRVGDCVIRAVSKALDMGWEETYLDLSIQGYMMGDLLSSNAVWGNYLKNKGYCREVISNECPDCYTISDFCKEHPHGTFIVGTGTHAVAVISGNIYDAWDSSMEQPIYYYVKKEVNEDVRTDE